MNQSSTISHIHFPLAKWRYWLLFQSLRQVVNWFSWVALTVLAVELVFALVDGPDIPVAVLLPSMAAGASGSLVMVLRARFFVRDNGAGELLRLQTQIVGLNYVLLEGSGERWLYRQKLPQLLRWDEGNIEVCCHAGEIRITGPLFILRTLRSLLLA